MAHRAGGSFYAMAGPDALRLDTDVGLRGEDLHTVADFTVSEGDRVPFVLSYYRSYRNEPPRVDPAEPLRRCERWCREWIGRCTYQGPYREAVTICLDDDLHGILHRIFEGHPDSILLVACWARFGDGFQTVPRSVSKLSYCLCRFAPYNDGIGGLAAHLIARLSIAFVGRLNEEQPGRVGGLVSE